MKDFLICKDGTAIRFDKFEKFEIKGSQYTSEIWIIGRCCSLDEGKPAMRILSKHKDYYDNVQQFGIDKSILYVRNQEFVEYTGDRFHTSFYLNSAYYYVKPAKGYKIDHTVIGFCGKIYNCFGLYNSQNEFIKHIYDIDELFEYVILYNNYNKNNFLNNLNWNTKATNLDFVKELFKKAPIFTYYHVSPSFNYICLTYNACLSDYSFGKVVHAHEAYMEIYKYFANKAHPEPNIVEVSDENRLEAKGFDKKWSFRKEKKN
jgi:hypothetical protein